MAIPAATVAFFVYLEIERHYRRVSLPGFRQFPWFTSLAAVGLFTVFFIGDWLAPIVMRNPKWCRAQQVIEWPTSNNQQFILVLSGLGNFAEHKFSSGSINWTDDGLAGISSIPLRPIRFGSWKGYPEVFVDGSPAALRQGIAGSRLPDAELDSLTTSIWDVLLQASEGRTVTSSTARVGVIRDTPFGHIHRILGGRVWMATLTFLFLIVGQLTVVRESHKLYDK